MSGRLYFDDSVASHLTWRVSLPGAFCVFLCVSVYVSECHLICFLHDLFFGYSALFSDIPVDIKSMRSVNHYAE